MSKQLHTHAAIAEATLYTTVLGVLEKKPQFQEIFEDHLILSNLKIVIARESLNRTSPGLLRTINDNRTIGTDCAIGFLKEAIEMTQQIRPTLV